jgi:tetratricopeptide (TPR) repeat protein
LIEAISAAENSTYPDDAAIASTCLAQVYWLQESPLEALHILGSSAAQAQSTDTSPSTLGWLEVCQVKNAFISAACLEASGRQSEARESYQAAVLKTPGYRSPELRTWTERLLGRACMYSVKKMPSPSIHDLHETYTAFRAWGEFWQRVPSSTPFTPFSGRWDVSRRQVWKAYHELLSTILQQDVLYSPYQDAAAESFIPSTTILPSEQITTVKQRQRAEMIRIEKTYESILLAEMKFPKASEINAEVEEWVKQVVANWRIFTSRWTDTELGEGGKDAVSRNVLEILYRAATKTFHSTAILRQLFTVHAALGEFDLAMHAFDSYVEIIDRGKARSEKTGHHEEGLDDDDTAMLTAAEAVRLLCRYGDREQGEKANEIIGAMSKWLAQQPPIAGNDSQNGEKAEEETTSSSPRIDSSLKPSTLAAAYRAMGICQAHWAQLTYDSASRPSLLADATKNLRRAQRFDPQSVDTAHALALVLAEMRDVSGSLQVLRSALQDSVMLNGDVASEQHCDRERRLLSMWHLLALCLTGQDKYDTAAQICEAAYKQFGSARVLFGQASVLAQGIPENSVSIVPPTQGLASQMESYEKECILQVRMSQLLLIELTEGPDAAVNLTDSLFGLYNKLFGNPSTVVAAPTLPPQTAASATPSRFGGTLRSITGSIRPRSARSRHSSCERRTITRQRSATVDASLVPAHDSRTATNDPSSGAPIAITVTNEDGNSAGKPHHRHHLHVPFRHRDNSSSVSTASENKEEGSTPRVKPRANSTAAADLGASSKQQLDNVAHNASAGQLPRPTGHEDQPPVQDVRLPGPHPAAVSGVPESTLLPKHERRHKVSVLLQTWLFVAEMYVRAEAHDEAQNAIEDAFKLVTALENEHGASDDGSNARKLYQKGWGGGKSIDVLWADAWSTVRTRGVTSLRCCC